jgi:hypothetical protein
MKIKRYMIYKVLKNKLKNLESIDKFLKLIEAEKINFNISKKKFLLENQAFIEINKKKAIKFWVFLFETDIIFFQFHKETNFLKGSFLGRKSSFSLKTDISMLSNNSENEKIKFYSSYDLNEDNIEYNIEVIENETSIKLDCNNKKGSKKELYQISFINEKGVYNFQLQKRWIDTFNKLFKKVIFQQLIIEDPVIIKKETTNDEKKKFNFKESLMNKVNNDSKLTVKGIFIK